MEKNQKILIGSISLVIVILLILTFTIGEGGNFLKRLMPAPTSTPSPTTIPTPTPLNAETVMFTGLKFTPGTLRIPIGKSVNFANFGDDPIEVILKDTSSGKEVSLGTLNSGDTSEFMKFDTRGVYEYFNKLKPAQKGRIIAE